MQQISASRPWNIRLAAVCAMLLICALPGHAQTEARKLPVSSFHQPTAAAAQPAGLSLVDPSPAFEYVNSFGGVTTTAAVSGTLGLVDEGGRLVVLDLQDAAHPTRRASAPLAARAVVIRISGGLAFVVVGFGIQVFDIVDPDHPRLVGEYRIGRTGYRLEIIDQLAYLFLDGATLEIIDISDPSHLVRKALVAIPLDGFGFRMSVTDGQLLYTADEAHRLRISDIREPASPRLVYLGPALPSTMGCTYIERYAKQVFVNCYDGVTIYDVSDPQHAQVQGRVALSQIPNSLWASSNRLYVRNPETPTLDIIDITDPAHPEALGSIPVPSDVVKATTDLLYIMRAGAAPPNGSIGQLEIVDITHPASPLTLGTYRPFPLPFATTLKMAGALAFLTNSYDGGTQIVDVTDPLSPTLRGTIPEARAVQIVGQLAYVVNPAVAGLSIYDISDPDAPQLRGSVATPFAAGQLIVAGERAYVLGNRLVSCQECTLYMAHLTIVDVHDPTAPTILGTLDPLGQGQSFPGDVMAIRGTTLYVLTTGKLQIVDVSNPSAPTLRETLGGGSEIQLDGSYAYTAANYQGLTIFDISQPEHPTAIGTAGTGASVIDQLAVSNGLAMFGLSGGPLRLIDATRPRSPLLRGSYSSYPQDIHVVGDMVYVIDRDGSLQILRVKPSGFTQPVFVPLAYR